MSAFLGWAVIVSTALSEGIPPSDAAADPSALLLKCTQTQSLMDHASYQLVLNNDNEADFHDPYHMRSEFSVRRDGDRLAVEGVARYFDQRRKDLSRRFQIVVNKTERLSSAWRLNDTKPRSGTFTKGSGADDIERTCGELDGYFMTVRSPGEPPQRIADRLLRHGMHLESQREEMISGTPCKVVVGELPQLGRIIFWLAEDKGCLPLKINHELGPTDLNVASNEPLSELKRPDPDDPNKSISLVGLSYTLDEVQIGKVEGEFVCIAGRLTRVEKWTRGELKNVSKITRSEIKLRPTFEDSDFAPKPLPEGAIIGNDDNPGSGLLYAWQQGKVVPAYSGFADSAEGKWSARSLWLFAFWLVLGLVVLTVSVRYIWRYKKAGA